MGKSRGSTNAMKIGLVQQRNLEAGLRNELDQFSWMDALIWMS